MVRHHCSTSSSGSEPNCGSFSRNSNLVTCIWTGPITRDERDASGVRRPRRHDAREHPAGHVHRTRVDLAPSDREHVLSAAALGTGAGLRLRWGGVSLARRWRRREIVMCLARETSVSLAEDRGGYRYIHPLDVQFLQLFSNDRTSFHCCFCLLLLTPPRSTK